MTVYAFYIFDRHTECIYCKRWVPFDGDSQTTITPKAQKYTSGSSVLSDPDADIGSVSSMPQQRFSRGTGKLTAQDDAKLVFGVVFSLRNMVRKLGGMDDNFISYRTSQYKLHYYETPTNLKFVMLTDIKTNNLRSPLHQIYVNLYVEYVVKNPLSPVEHPGGAGVANELFEMSLDKFVTKVLNSM